MRHSHNSIYNALLWIWAAIALETVLIVAIAGHVEQIARGQVQVNLHFSNPAQVRPTLQALRQGLPKLEGLGGEMTITLRNWDTGDWFELYVNGEMIHAGHDLPHAVLFDLPKEMGAEVFEESVPGEEE